MEDYKAILPYLKKKAQGTVAIFQRKDSRELFNEDARLVADQLLMSDVGIRNYYLDNSELTVLSLNKMQLNRVIRDLLLVLRCRVELYEEDISGKGFEVTAKGDLTHYDDFKDVVEGCVELSELSTLMAVRMYSDNMKGVEENKITAVFCNPHDMRITVAEFDDTPNFSNLSECIQIMVPRQCLVFKADRDANMKAFIQLENALRRPNLPYSVIDYSSKDLDKIKEEFLSLLFKDWSGYSDPSLSANVLKTAAPLFEHMHLLPEYAGSFLVVQYETAGYMHMDAAAVKALELFSLVQDDEDEPVRSNGTLYGILNKCYCDLGRRLLRNWMRRPLSNLRSINERLDVVECLTESHSARQALSLQLKRIPDVMVIERKLLQKKASLVDCVRLYRIVEALDDFDSILDELVDTHEDQKAAAVKALLWDPIKTYKEYFANFKEQIETYVDMDYFDEANEYRIKSDVDEELQRCWTTLEKFERKAKRLCEGVAATTGLDSIKLDTENGFIFRAPLREEKVIARHKYEIIDIKRNLGVVFVNKELKALSSESAEVMKRYNELQKQLTQKVVEVAVKQAGNLQGLNDIIALIDVLVAFSTISIESSGGYVRPELLEPGTGVFELRECRHPVIELKEDMEYIPNDIVLNYESKDGKITGSRFAVITGANMGGKSTYLRSAGLSVIMGQMGCFVPCESARFSIVDGIYTRVGASDYQCSGVSTFMAEMMDCVAILDAAKSTSLVLVDELGRGTSTYDGFSLAWGVADHILNKIGCFCLFATHYHEMSLLKEKFPNDVANLKVDTFTGKDGEITFLYKIVEGLAERSFGINIANTLKFPEKIIVDAKKILNFLETNSWENSDEIDPLLNEKAQTIKEEELNALISKIKEEMKNINDPAEVKKKVLELTQIVA